MLRIVASNVQQLLLVSDELDALRIQSYKKDRHEVPLIVEVDVSELVVSSQLLPFDEMLQLILVVELFNLVGYLTIDVLAEAFWLTILAIIYDLVHVEEFFS